VPLSELGLKQKTEEKAMTERNHLARIVTILDYMAAHGATRPKMFNNYTAIRDGALKECRQGYRHSIVFPGYQ